MMRKKPDTDTTPIAHALSPGATAMREMREREVAAIRRRVAELADEENAIEVGADGVPPEAEAKIEAIHTEDALLARKLKLAEKALDAAIEAERVAKFASVNAKLNERGNLASRAGFEREWHPIRNRMIEAWRALGSAHADALDLVHRQRAAKARFAEFCAAEGVAVPGEAMRAADLGELRDEVRALLTRTRRDGEFNAAIGERAETPTARMHWLNEEN